MPKRVTARPRPPSSIGSPPEGAQAREEGDWVVERVRARDGGTGLAGNRARGGGAGVAEAPEIRLSPVTPDGEGCAARDRPGARRADDALAEASGAEERADAASGFPEEEACAMTPAANAVPSTRPPRSRSALGGGSRSRRTCGTSGHATVPDGRRPAHRGKYAGNGPSAKPHSHPQLRQSLLYAVASTDRVTILLERMPGDGAPRVALCFAFDRSCVAVPTVSEEGNLPMRRDSRKRPDSRGAPLGEA